MSNQYGCRDHVPSVVDLFVTDGNFRPAAEAMLSAPRWAMAEVLDRFDTDYGGIQAYLRSAGGMADATLESLRAYLIT